MFRKSLLPFLLALSILLGACATTTPAPTATLEPTPIPPTPTDTLEPTPIPPTPTAVQEPTPVPQWPMTLTDSLGRQVTLEQAPARIVSLAPSNTEILFAVGAGDAVVGVTKYCDYPAEAQQLPQVGGFSAKTISVETIVSLKPDLVLANAPGHEPLLEALEQAGINVIAISAASFEDVYANIELVGQVTGHQEEAKQVVDQMKARVAAVAEKIATIAPENRPTVFWEVWDEPLMTAGPNTFIGQMIEMAGGINIFADLTEDYPQISMEEVIQRNPDVIMGPDSHGDKLDPDQLVSRPGWEHIEAVKNGRVYLIDGSISSRPGPRLVDALETIAAALYPEVFK